MKFEVSPRYSTRAGFWRVANERVSAAFCCRDISGASLDHDALLQRGVHPDSREEK
jgi:hypothetical protein